MNRSSRFSFYSAVLLFFASLAQSQQLSFVPFHSTGMYRLGEKAGWTVSAAKDAAAALKVKGETAKLKARAEAAEHYALAAVDVAVAAIDAAEHAALEAWLARRDADHAPGK